jgi:hypothetical protein
MRRRLLPSIHHSGTRLLRRVDSAAYRINPYLLALAVGLIILNVTFFFGWRCLRQDRPARFNLPLPRSSEISGPRRQSETARPMPAANGSGILNRLRYDFSKSPNAESASTSFMNTWCASMLTSPSSRS